VTGLCYVPSVKNYWITGKNRKLVAYDPRTPTNITPYVKETSRFDEFHIARLHHPPGSDVVLGITTARQLVVWRYNPASAFRVLNGHRDWVEALVVVRREAEDGIPQVYSAGSDGLLLKWQANSELNTDLFTCQEELTGHEGSILCIIYSTEFDMLITGSEDTTIRLWPLGASLDIDASAGDGELPNMLLGHDLRVTGITEVMGHMLASVSHDMSLRFWDLHTRHEISCISRAHDSPLHSVEYGAVVEEIATAAQDPVVKVWNAFKPFTLKLLLTGHAGDVTSVKWCEWRLCWITAANDHSIRVWSTEGETTYVFGFRGESITAMHLDISNRLLLAGMLDRAIRVYDLAQLENEVTRVNLDTEDEQAEQSMYSSLAAAEVAHIATPVMKYAGHTDLVRSIVHVEEKGQYLSGGWDKTIRVWFSPKIKDEGQWPSGQSQPEATALDVPDDEDQFVSTYEKENPLVQPRALRNQAGFTLKLTKIPAPRKGHDDKQSGECDEDLVEKESCTSLGRRLNELEAKLSMRIGATEQPPPKAHGRGGIGRGAGPTRHRGR